MKAPIEMPTDFFAQVEFDILRNDLGSPDSSARFGGVQSGFPLWYSVYTLDTLGQDESDAIRAFKDRMRGQLRLFLARDLTRLYPKAHSNGFAGMVRAGGGAFAGDATDWSETITADSDSQVTLQGLPDGLELGLCDYIGFHWAATETAVAGLTWHTCVRVVEGGVADGTGELTVTSEPPIPLAVPDTAVAYLNQPACVMRLNLEQTKLQAVGRRSAIGGGQISAVQDLRS